MEHIWNLTDTNDFVIAMMAHLDDKTQYGDDVSVLSEAERIFYITQTLEMEVNNGGKRNAGHAVGKGQDVAALSRGKYIREDCKEAAKKSRHRFPLCSRTRSRSKRDTRCRESTEYTNGGIRQ